MLTRLAETPGKVALFNEIAAHVHGKLTENGEPDPKRRKVQAGSATNGATNGSSAAGNPADDPILLQVKEISVSVPQRKKFELCFTKNFLYARAPGTTVPIQSMIYAWTDFGSFPRHVPPLYPTTNLGRICVLSPRPRKSTSTTQLCLVPSRLDDTPKVRPCARRTARFHSPCYGA